MIFNKLKNDNLHKCEIFVEKKAKCFSRTPNLKARFRRYEAFQEVFFYQDSKPEAFKTPFLYFSTNGLLFSKHTLIGRIIYWQGTLLTDKNYTQNKMIFQSLSLAKKGTLVLLHFL
ncbi:hypothetical protein [Thermoflexibacter ruber]|uniref:hypothetical protein n=1 Tax=Thermoflexibacter ruber TaxID=1003 RepID=UPI000B898AB6|nr:hypothetical protein [Thermoflexibacter ruber]